MTAGRITQWRKSSYSSDSIGNCVEVGAASDWRAVRDSKVGSSGPVLLFSVENWNSFVSLWPRPRTGQ
jgi:hypothetical protein